MAKEPYLIGISGPSGAGKSSVSNRLVKLLKPNGAIIIPLDSYYKDLSGLDPEERDRRNFDIPGALDSDLLIRQLGDLSQGRSIEMPVYQFPTHTIM